MSSNKKTLTVVSISVIFALGLGIAIGTSIKGKGKILAGDNNNNSAAQNSDVNFTDKSVEELNTKLSEILLPEDEYVKLDAAILQTGMGLFMAQAQNAGVTVSDEAQQELKKNISEKYSRKYFSDMNAASMKELSKDDLVTILSFYHTKAGAKFLELSPKIIQTTMQTVQTDLSDWLPKTVDALVTRLKGGNKDAPKEEGKKEPVDQGEKADS